LTPRSVRFTATAQRHIQQEKAWWLKNRIHTELLATELEAALRLLALLPGAGALYTKVSVPGLRRWYLPKVGCHLYYTFDEKEVIVRAFWGAHRRRGPQIKL
jgi:hypothetical protein